MASSSSESTNTGTQQVDIVPLQDNIPVEEPGENGAASTTIESLTPGLYKELPSSLEIRRHQVRGRGIWSKRDFKRGSILVRHRPPVSILSTPNLSTYCSFCISKPKSNENLKRCAKCKLIWYCTSTCQNADWAIHKHECRAISRWMSFTSDPPDEAVRSMGRLLYGKQVKGDTSPWWKEAQALQSNRESTHPSQTPTQARLSQTLVRYLGVTNSEELLSYGIRSARDLVDLISKFTINTFTLASPSLEPLGTCISPIAALFNHSCVPNAVIVFPRSSRTNGQPSLPEPVLHVVALRDISPGEEVLTAYLDTTLPTSQRQQTLQEVYSFTCGCPLCTSTNNVDPREALWCPNACGSLCSAPFNQESPLPQCAKCKATYTKSAMHDIADQRRVGQDALIKATSLQASDPAKALNLTSHMIPLLDRTCPPSSHPTLALLRLHQLLLVSSLASTSSSTDTPVQDEAIHATARAVAGLTAVLEEGHPARGVLIAELGKLLAMDEQPQPGTSSPSRINLSGQSEVFPPTGAARLELAIDTLKRARKELIIGFGESTEGGEVGVAMRDDIITLETELSIWRRAFSNNLQSKSLA